MNDKPVQRKRPSPVSGDYTGLLGGVRAAKAISETPSRKLPLALPDPTTARRKYQMLSEIFQTPSGKSSRSAFARAFLLPNKLLVREYLTALPDERLLAAELEKTRKQLEFRK
jgi:hypothetical protein